MAGEEHEIKVYSEAAALSERLAEFHQSSEDVALLARLGGGAIRFAEAAFPGADTDKNIYAQFNQRESKGRGPHFDIYEEGLSENYPWLAVFNLTGTCDVSAAVMPGKLADEYYRLYPEPTPEAHEARRHFGAIVLKSSLTKVYRGRLEPDTGMILPQREGDHPIIHEVVRNRHNSQAHSSK